MTIFDDVCCSKNANGPKSALHSVSLTVIDGAFEGHATVRARFTKNSDKYSTPPCFQFFKFPMTALLLQFTNSLEPDDVNKKR